MRSQVCLLSKNITFCGTSLEGTSTDVLLLDIYKSINVLHDLQYFYYKAVFSIVLLRGIFCNKSHSHIGQEASPNEQLIL